MGFRVIRVVQRLLGETRETVTAFPERWEAEEFIKTRNEEEKIKSGGVVWYAIEETAGRPLPEPLTVGATLKTIGELISEAIGLHGGNAELKQIYKVVQKERPRSSEHSIRGVLNHAVEDGKLVRHEDHTYSLGTLVPKSFKSRKSPKSQRVRQLPTTGAIKDGNLFSLVDLPEGQLESFVLQSSPEVFGRGALFIPKKKLVGSHIKKITDGLLLDLSGKPAFWIVEVELSKHPEEHIQSQVLGFLRALKKDKSIMSLVKEVYDHLVSGEVAEWAMEFLEPIMDDDPKLEAYPFIEEILRDRPGVIIVIDKVTPKIREVVSDLSDGRPVKLIEFKTFRLKDDLIHVFSEPDLSQSD